MICVSIGHKDQLVELDSNKVNLVELRFDLLKVAPDTIMPEVNRDLKIISTCRPGNGYSDTERLQILTRSMELGAAMVDIELESDNEFRETIIRSAKKNNCDIIISWHDFNYTPDYNKLTAIYTQCFNSGADIAKIATMVKDREDMIRLISLHQLPGRKVILGMGELGGITRVAAPLMGSEFTFASSGQGETTAPGQITFEELLNIYKILKIK